jgi:hypothetical protein
LRIIKLIDLVVDVANPASLLDVTLDEGGEAPAEHIPCAISHRDDVADWSCEGLVAEHQIDASDALGMVAHPLELVRDKQHRDDDTEVGGHRPL